jgi:CDP-4-dehydro-6-deoxyglucose reductase, E1
MKISLSHDTVSQDDLEKLITWLRTNPRLTQGEKVKEFEAAFAKKVGSRYAVYVNSGSSANLIMLYALKVMGKLPKNRVALPAICWATDLAPLIQFGIEPVLLDVAPGLVQDDFTLSRMRDCDAFLCVSALGFVEDYGLIRAICNDYGVTLVEDACESLGSKYSNSYVGTMGLMGTFSFYFSHHISTIEGGMVVTDDEECYTVLKMLRSHGWSRDIDPARAGMLKTVFGVSDFNEKFTFYLPGFNVRGTDLQAMLGLEQLAKLDGLVQTRNENYYHYEKYMPRDLKLTRGDYSKGYLSNFGFPIASKNRNAIAKALSDGGVECRPLISGSMALQPMWRHYVNKKTDTRYADSLTDTGMYLPNHGGMGEKEVKYICNIVEKVI